MIIKDSGERTEFASGAVRDLHEGKGRMDLLPWASIIEVSKHCEEGAKKYGEHNVDKGIPTHSLCDSAARHLAKYLDGQTDENHLVAAVWNLLWAVQMVLKNPECVDTPWKKPEQAEEAEIVLYGTEGAGERFSDEKYNELVHAICESHECGDCPLGHIRGDTCQWQSRYDRDLIRKAVEEYANAKN